MPGEHYVKKYLDQSGGNEGTSELKFSLWFHGEEWVRQYMQIWNR